MPLLLGMPGNEAMTQALAERLRTAIVAREFRHFPDGETYIRIDSPIQHAHLAVVCTLDRPDDKLLPLLFGAGTAKALGAASVGLICPYLAYMRQDRRFQSGESITSVHFAKLLSRWFDWLVTVDPHLHRRRSLSEIYDIPASALHAAPLVSAWIRDNVERPLLVGPDAESEQWVRAVAEGAEAPYVVLEKVRHGDRDVEVKVPQVERWNDRTPILVDDIISTAGTMIETIRHLAAQGFAGPVCIGVHGIFAANAYADLLAAGAGRVVTSNTIAHETNAIDVSALLAQAVTERD